MNVIQYIVFFIESGENMKVDIICPLYNAEKYIYNLNSAILNQKNIDINNVKYILTESSDKTEKILKELAADYKKIKRSEFSHSLVRENAAKESNADIIVFITQDIVIESDNWLEKLVMPIINNEADASYSRQLSKYNNIEKYTREKNYPDISCIKTKEDISRLGLNTFFFSDASSAIRNKTFKELNWYDEKNLPINEDMYIAYKLIMNNKKIKYCADSVVYHSHSFSLKELYDRYKLTGKFFKENSYFNEFSANKSGVILAKYVLKRMIQEKRLGLLVRYPFDMAARFIGMKVGKM